LTQTREKRPVQYLPVLDSQPSLDVNVNGHWWALDALHTMTTKNTTEIWMSLEASDFSHNLEIKYTDTLQDFLHFFVAVCNELKWSRDRNRNRKS